MKGIDNMNRNFFYLAQYVDTIDNVTEIIGIFTTVDKAEQAVADTLIEYLNIDDETPIERILDEFSDRYMIDKCTVDYNYMV